MAAKFLDFAALKAAISIDRVADWLQVDLKKQPNGQMRGCCPIHQGSNEREFVITPSKGLYFCFGPCGGGDCIKLTAHVLKIGTKEAAQKIAEHFEFGKGTSNSTSTVDRTVPASITNDAPSPQPTDALKPLEHLATDHPAIDALGLSQAVCAALGIGYAGKGLMRGRIVFPLRLPNGTLVGYQGLATSGDQAPLILFPKSLDERVSAPSPQEEKPKGNADDLRKLFRVVA
jgi:DNA primase